MLVLSEKEVRNIIEIKDLVRVLEEAHVQYSTGKAIMPVRQVVPLAQIKGRITSMPAYLSEANALGMKVVTYFEENPKSGLPSILATISLYSPETGRLTALMDGSYVTAIRTACASAMATKALANSETPIMGILGAGVQARAHIRALSQFRQFREIRVYSPSGTSARKLKEELEPECGSKIEAVGSPENAVRDADLVVTVSTAKEPVLRAEWLKSGCHINAVGSHRPEMRELEAEVLKRATVVVDSRDAIMAECGDVLLAIKEGTITEDQVQREIGAVLAGQKPGRTSPDELTVYKSVGIAIQDVATARLVYQKALEQKVGVDVEV